MAPGYWRCIATIEELVGGPGLTGHFPGPPVISQMRTCGTRYAEGVGPSMTTPMCACLTNSLGECATCGRAVCFDHSRLVDGRRRCVNCIQVDLEAASAARLERRRREEEIREQARREREKLAAEYAALPAMDPGDIAYYLMGRIDDGPDGCGYRLPERLVGHELREVLQLIPATARVVTQTIIGLNLMSRPAWRVGTQSRYRGRSGTGFAPVVMFDDRSTVAVYQRNGRWHPWGGFPLADAWDGSNASLRSMRDALKQGMSVPEFQPYPYGD
jgi:hypothetical protein